MNDMDVRAFMREAALNGVTLWLENGQLRFKAPKDKVTDAWLAELRSKKHALIGELSVPVYEKRASPPAVTRFPECTKGFWEECQANASLRHGLRFALKLTGRIDLARIEAAFEWLRSRHDLLRSTVAVGDDGIPLLQRDDDPPAPVSIVDLSGNPVATTAAQIQAAVERAIYSPFNDGHIFRAQVLKISQTEYVVAVVIHHFVADVVSIEIVQRELLAALETKHDSKPRSGERPMQYSDYLLGMRQWLSGPGLEYRLRLWKEKMRGAPAVRFPLTNGTPSAGPARLETIDMQVGATLRAKLARANAVAGVPFPVTILAAHFAALANTFDSSDLVNVLLYWGRNEPELFDMVGFTVNCLPVRVKIAPGMSYVDLMTELHDTFAFARDYSVPWASLMSVLADVDASYIAPLFNYTSIAQEAPNASTSNTRDSGVRSEPVEFDGPQQTNSVDWKSYELHATDTGVEMEVVLKYMPSVYQTASVKEFLNTLLHYLEALGNDPMARVISDRARTPAPAAARQAGSH